MAKFENSWGIRTGEGWLGNSLSRLEGGWRGRDGSGYKAERKFRRRGITQKKTYNRYGI